MIASPMRFQLVVATVAIGGAFALTESQGPSPEAGPVFSFQDPTIDESSGLVDAGSTVLTVNDSGDDAVVYVIDRSSGETVGRTTYTSDEVIDVEAMAPGPDGALWVGDIGDNPASRSSIAVYELPMPTPGDRSVEAERYVLVYEGGPRDAEALLVHPTTGRLYVVSKSLFAGKVYEAPQQLSADKANVLRPVADAGGLVTDGAFFPDGRFAALRSYSNLSILAADGWRTVQGMPLPDQNQGEGLAMTATGRRVLISTEGAGSEVQDVPLTRDILDRIAEPSSAPSPRDRPSPDRSPPRRELSPPEDDGALWQVAGLAAGTLGVVGAAVIWLRRRRY